MQIPTNQQQKIKWQKQKNNKKKQLVSPILALTHLFAHRDYERFSLTDWITHLLNTLSNLFTWLLLFNWLSV